MPATNPAIIMGTAAYMSPEQAKGRAVDRRTDIFALGCVFYEMLTTRPAFDGDDVTDILGAVLRMEPDWSQLPDDVPSAVRNMLRWYLEKNPKNRRSDATDVRLDIEQALNEPVVTAHKPINVVRRPLWKQAIPVALALLLGGGMAGVAFWKLTPVPVLRITRFPITLGEGQQFTNPRRMLVAISPDGTHMVYVANSRLYLRAMSEIEARAIPGTENWGGSQNPVFSPDGRSIVFHALSDRTLKKIAVSGGAAVTLCPAEAPFGMSWGEDGIVFGAGNKGILRVSENGGKPELLASVQDNELAHGPQVLPGGEAVLFTVGTDINPDDAWDNGQIVVQSLKPGSARQVIIKAGNDARFVSTGHIVFALGGIVFAVPFDVRRLQVTGGQVPVVEGVRRASNNTASAQFVVSNTGSLVYIPGPVVFAPDRTLAMLGRQGGLERLKVPPKPYRFPRLSPDGEWAAVSTDDPKDTSVWIVDLSGAIAPRQLTLGGANRYPVWSADGERVLFQSDREGDLGIFWQKADGSGIAERLTKPEQGVANIPDSASPDKKWLSYTAVKGTEFALWILSLQDKKATVFAEKAGAQIGRSAFSPDGQWLAYQSTETGVNRIFVQAFPAGTRYAVTTGGQPFWSPDGRELIYHPSVLGSTNIDFIGIATRPTFSFGEPARLPGGTAGLHSRNPAIYPRVWDITPDGKRIIGVIDALTDSLGTPAVPKIHVVLNWFSELQQRVPVK
jgi:serine/threonine-protein kinase